MMSVSPAGLGLTAGFRSLDSFKKRLTLHRKSIVLSYQSYIVWDSHWYVSTVTVLRLYFQSSHCTQVQ